jgi:hypothetical protein
MLVVSIWVIQKIYRRAQQKAKTNAQTCRHWVLPRPIAPTNHYNLSRDNNWMLACCLLPVRQSCGHCLPAYSSFFSLLSLPPSECKCTELQWCFIFVLMVSTGSRKAYIKNRIMLSLTIAQFSMSTVPSVIQFRSRAWINFPASSIRPTGWSIPFPLI